MLQFSSRVLVLNIDLVLSIFKDSLLALNHIDSLLNSMFIIYIISQSFEYIYYAPMGLELVLNIVKLGTC